MELDDDDESSQKVASPPVTTPQAHAAPVAYEELKTVDGEIRPDRIEGHCFDFQKSSSIL